MAAARPGWRHAAACAPRVPLRRSAAAAPRGSNSEAASHASQLQLAAAALRVGSSLGVEAAGLLQARASLMTAALANDGGRAPEGVRTAAARAIADTALSSAANALCLLRTGAPAVGAAALAPLVATLRDPGASAQLRLEAARAVGALAGGCCIKPADVLAAGAVPLLVGMLCGGQQACGEDGARGGTSGDGGGSAGSEAAASATAAAAALGLICNMVDVGAGDAEGGTSAVEAATQEIICLGGVPHLVALLCRGSASAAAVATSVLISLSRVPAGAGALKAAGALAALYELGTREGAGNDLKALAVYASRRLEGTLRAQGAR